MVVEGGKVSAVSTYLGSFKFNWTDRIGVGVGSGVEGASTVSTYLGS